jgi:hypothetical protein
MNFLHLDLDPNPDPYPLNPDPIRIADSQPATILVHGLPDSLKKFLPVLSDPVHFDQIRILP